MVERVEIDVAEQQTAHRALRRALFGGPLFEPVEHSLFKERLDQAKNATVRHLLPDQGEKTVFGDRIEIALQIGVHDVDVAGLEQLIDPPQRVLAAPSGAKAVAVRSKVPLEDRLQYRAQRRLHHPVLDRLEGAALSRRTPLAVVPCLTTISRAGDGLGNRLDNK
jgi:hypothetical protein